MRGRGTGVMGGLFGGGWRDDAVKITAVQTGKQVEQGAWRLVLLWWPEAPGDR